MDKQKLAIKADALRIYTNCRASAQIQFEAAKIYRRHACLTGTIATVGSAAGGLGILASFPGWIPILFALSASTASFLSVLSDPSGKAKQSEISGHDYVLLRNDVDTFLRVDLEQMQPALAREKLEELKFREGSLNAQIVLAPDRAVRRWKQTTVCQIVRARALNRLKPKQV